MLEMRQAAVELSPLKTSFNLSLELEQPLGFAKTPQIQFPVAEVREPLTTDAVTE